MVLALLTLQLLARVVQPPPRTLQKDCAQGLTVALSRGGLLFYERGKHVIFLALLTLKLNTRVVLHPRGFEFQIRETSNISVLDGRLVGQHTIEKPDNPFADEGGVDTGVPHLQENATP